MNNINSLLSLFGCIKIVSTGFKMLPFAAVCYQLKCVFCIENKKKPYKLLTGMYWRNYDGTARRTTLWTSTFDCFHRSRWRTISGIRDPITGGDDIVRRCRRHFFFNNKCGRQNGGGSSRGRRCSATGWRTVQQVRQGQTLSRRCRWTCDHYFKFVLRMDAITYYTRSRVRRSWRDNRNSLIAVPSSDKI